MRRVIAIPAVSTGTLVPNRGSVARNARSRKIASIRSPRACLIASAARSRSYSEPSFITRSTASVSCSLICSSASSGTAGSPRRACASRRCAFSIARSPPLTATYISSLPLACESHRARQRRDLVGARQDEIDAAWKQRAIDGEPCWHVVRQPGGVQHRPVADARPCQRERRSAAQRRNLHHERGGAIRIVRRAETEGLDRRQ